MGRGERCRTRCCCLALALALALAACTGMTGDSDEGADASAQPGTPDAPEPETDGGDEAEETPRTAPEPPGEPLATVEGTVTGYGGDSLPATLEILDLRRSGDVVTLAFAINLAEGADIRLHVVCPFAAEVDTGDDAPQARCRSMSGVTLVDPVNGNRHLVLREPDGACACTSNIPVRLSGGQRYSFGASFAAPPGDVRAMSVSVPQFAGVEDVPISGS